MYKNSKSKRSRSTIRKPTKKTYKKFQNRSYALATRTVGLGTSATTVLRTSFFYNASSAAGTGVFTGFLRPGSCYDPTGDLSTIQPQMFDQFAAQYNRYLVNSAVVRVKITGASAGANGTVWVAAMYPAVDATALATYQAAASQQFARTTSGGFQTTSIGGVSLGTGTEGQVLSFRINQPSITGYKGDPIDSGALVSANPTDLQHMVLPIFLQANVAVLATWVLEIDIWQNTTFSQKKNTVDA